MRYGALEIGDTPGARSMTNSTARLGGNPGSSPGNTSENSATTGIMDNSLGLDSGSSRVAEKTLQPSPNHSVASLTDTIQEDGSFHDPWKMTPISQLQGLVNTLLPLQSRKAWCADNQSIPNSTSNPIIP